MALDLNALMDALGVRLATITGLRVYDYSADTAAVPAAIVGLPSQITYDYTKGRGSDRIVIQIFLLVGRTADRAARDQLSAYLAGSGAQSIKAAIDDAQPVGYRSRVMGARNSDQAFTMNGVTYVGAIFDVELID